MKKIGAHVMSGYGGSLGGLPGVVLVNVSWQYVRDARAQLGPNKTIIVRWETPYQPLDNPEQNALDWFAQHKFDMLLMTNDGKDRRVIFQGYNEIAGAQAEPYYWFEKRRSELMRGANLPMAWFSWSVGECDIRIWPLFASLIRTMPPDDVVLLHEYWVDRDGINNPWHCARWQLVPELKNVRIVVGECGRDIVEGRGRPGWRLTCSRQDFERDLQAYDALLCWYLNVDFAAVYGCGWVTNDWKMFDSNELIPWIIANTEQTAPAPTPQPEAPMEQDKDLLVCWPVKNTHKAWYITDQHPVWGPGYDDHPDRAEDLNLESMGNSDLGEPLVAPFDAIVLAAANYGRPYGWIVQLLALRSQELEGKAVVYQARHMRNASVQGGEIVKMGQLIGEIGTGEGAYSAHAHIMLSIGPIPAPTTSWQDRRYQFVRPSDWFIKHGIARELVERLRKYDGR